MVMKKNFKHQNSLKHFTMTLKKYLTTAHLGAPRRVLRGNVMVTCHGNEKRHGNTAKSHSKVMVFPYRRERSVDSFLRGRVKYDVLHFVPGFETRWNKTM